VKAHTKLVKVPAVEAPLNHVWLEHGDTVVRIDASDCWTGSPADLVLVSVLTAGNRTEAAPVKLGDLAAALYRLVRRTQAADKPAPPAKKPRLLAFEVTLKGYDRVFDAPGEDDPFPEDVLARAGDLVKWVVAPTQLALKGWLGRNGLHPYLDEPPRALSRRPDITADPSPDSGVDLVLDEFGAVVRGATAEQWKQEAAAFGRALSVTGVVPVFDNVYVCPRCRYEWRSTDAGTPDADCGRCGYGNVTPRGSTEKYGFVDNEEVVRGGTDAGGK